MTAASTGLAARAGQRGGAAVEFAFVFPFLFLLMYGVIVYSYLFVLQESLNFAAQEAAEAAVAVDASQTGYQNLVQTRARQSAVLVLGWLPEAQKARVLGANGEKVSVAFSTSADQPLTSVVTVTINYEVEGLFPVLNLYFVGDIPPLPAQLTARAAVRI